MQASWLLAYTLLISSGTPLFNLSLFLFSYAKTSRCSVSFTLGSRSLRLSLASQYVVPFLQATPIILFISHVLKNEEKGKRERERESYVPQEHPVLFSPWRHFSSHRRLHTLFLSSLSSSSFGILILYFINSIFGLFPMDFIYFILAVLLLLSLFFIVNYGFWYFVLRIIILIRTHLNYLFFQWK